MIAYLLTEHIGATTHSTSSSLINSAMLQLLGVIGAAVAGVLGLVALVHKITKTARRVGHFLDDWSGEPARPGVPRRPGVLERLDEQDKRLQSVEASARQLTPNSGSHLADAINRMESLLTNREGRPIPLVRVEDRISDLEQLKIARELQLRHIERRLDSLEQASNPEVAVYLNTEESK